LKKDPWLDIDSKFKKGDVIKGKVTKINPFGAFIEVAPKIQGLVHISEFGTKTKMEEQLEIGKEYKFQVLQIEPQEHRMTLKLAE
jgi:small subunit ribosomal protein S1